MKKYLNVFMKKGNVVDETTIYSVKITKNTFLDNIKLFFSRIDPRWSKKVSGKLCAKLVNTGEGVSIFIGKQAIALDYSEVSELYLLLDQYEKQSEWKHVIKETK